MICDRQDWRCNACHVRLDDLFDIDHIVPFCISGDNRPQNLQALCLTCHARKSRHEYARIVRFKTFASSNTPLCWACNTNVDKDFFMAPFCDSCFCVSALLTLKTS